MDGETGRGRAPKETSRLVAAVTHEVVSPVSNIAGLSRLLTGDPQAALDDKTRDLLLRIRRNSVRLVHLVEEASTLARHHWELDAPQREKVDLRDIVDGALLDVVEVVGTGANGPDVRLPEGDLAAEGDPKRLRLAIGGLFLNLAKDLNNRRLTLALERAGSGWRITVWHAAIEGENGPFAEVEGEGGGPSAVVVLELFKSLGCAGKVFVSPEGARRIEVEIPQ
ncbi:MAG: HAMP domain-containing histidine kinase [Deltaproteobacteria bacterium]|nr:HAMP domain-containing histidine kinase [Deltaproteobacteria bacterium]